MCAVVVGDESGCSVVATASRPSVVVVLAGLFFLGIRRRQRRTAALGGRLN